MARVIFKKLLALLLIGVSLMPHWSYAQSWRPQSRFQMSWPGNDPADPFGLCFVGVFPDTNAVSSTFGPVRCVAWPGEVGYPTASFSAVFNSLDDLRSFVSTSRPSKMTILEDLPPSFHPGFSAARCYESSQTLESSLDWGPGISSPAFSQGFTSTCEHYSDADADWVFQPGPHGQYSSGSTAFGWYQCGIGYQLQTYNDRGAQCNKIKPSTANDVLKPIDPEVPAKQQSCPDPSVAPMEDPTDPRTGTQLIFETDYHAVSGLSLSRSYASGDGPSTLNSERVGFSLDYDVASAPPRYYVATVADGHVGSSQQGRFQAIAPTAPNGGSTPALTLSGLLTGVFHKNSGVWQNYNAAGSLYVYETGSGATRRIGVVDTDALIAYLFDDVGRLLLAKQADGTHQVEYRYQDSTGALYPSGSSVDCTAALPTVPGDIVKCAGDAFGRRIAFTTDGLGRVTDMALPSGSTVHYGYDSGDNLTTVTHEDTSADLMYYGETGYIPTGVPIAASYLTGRGTKTPTGIVTRTAFFTYDSNLQVARTEQPGGVDVQLYSYGKDSASNPQTTITRANGTVYRATYSGALMNSQSQVGGSGCAASVASFTHSGVGDSPSAYVDFSGNKTCLDYSTVENGVVFDGSGRGLRVVQVDGFTSAQSCPSTLYPYTPTAGTAQRKTTTLWHPVWRLRIREAAPSVITTWVYNGQPDPTNANAVASCAPTTALTGDQPIAVLCKKVEQATTDTNGALRFAATTAGNPRIWQWTYNQFGQKLTEDGPRTDVTDSSTWTYYSDTTVDHLPGDLQNITNPLGQVTAFNTYNRDGRVLKKTAADGAITEYLYTPRGWMTQVKVTPAGGGTAQITNITYEVFGKVTRVTQPDGSWIENSYDAAQRLVSQKDNLNNAVLYMLDTSGNRTKEEYRDPSGVLKRNIERSFDALNRMQASAGQ